MVCSCSDESHAKHKNPNKYIYVILLTNWNRLCLTFLSLLSHAACLRWPRQEWFSVFSNMQFSEITIIFTNTFLMKRFSVVQVCCAGVCILHNGTKKTDCVFLTLQTIGYADIWAWRLESSSVCRIHFNNKHNFPFFFSVQSHILTPRFSTFIL